MNETLQNLWRGAAAPLVSGDLCPTSAKIGDKDAV